MSCFVRDGFCTMALSSGRKKSTQSDSIDSKIEIDSLKLALLFQMMLIVLIAPYFLLILLCLRRSMPPSVRN
jgi:hypothetical protein